MNPYQNLVFHETVLFYCSSFSFLVQISVQLQSPQISFLLPAFMIFFSTAWENSCQEICEPSESPQADSTIVSYFFTFSAVAQTPISRFGHALHITSFSIHSSTGISSLRLFFTFSILTVNPLLYPFPSKKARHMPWWARSFTGFLIFLSPLTVFLSRSEPEQFWQYPE